MTGFSRISREYFFRVILALSRFTKLGDRTLFVTFKVTNSVFLPDFLTDLTTPMLLINALTKIFLSDQTLAIRAAKRLFDLVHLVIRILS